MNQFIKTLLFFFITSLAFAQPSEQQKLEEKKAQILKKKYLMQKHLVTLTKLNKCKKKVYALAGISAVQSFLTTMKL